MNFVKGKVVNGGQKNRPFGFDRYGRAKRSQRRRVDYVGDSPGARQGHGTVRSGTYPATLGKIASKNYLGDAALLEVEVKGVTLMAKLAGDCDLAVGAQAVLEFPAPYRLACVSLKTVVSRQ